VSGAERKGAKAAPFPVRVVVPIAAAKPLAAPHLAAERAGNSAATKSLVTLATAAITRLVALAHGHPSVVSARVSATASRSE